MKFKGLREIPWPFFYRVGMDEETADIGDPINGCIDSGPEGGGAIRRFQAGRLCRPHSVIVQ